MVTITTVNVNGLRAASGKGFDAWLNATKADAVCVQEVRAEAAQVPASLREPAGWAAPLIAPAAAKGRAGVGVYTRAVPTRTQIGFGSAEFDTSGRYVEVDLPPADGLPPITVASLYLPSGEADTPRQTEKERFMEQFFDYLVATRTKFEAEGRELVVCGDWNIAHREADLKNWKTNQKVAGFLPSERALLSRVFDEAGYVDVVRALHPDVLGPYSWWSYRGRAFDNDAGWRIDLVCTTPGIAAKAISAVVERAKSHPERWSDHAPVTVTFEA